MLRGGLCVQRMERGFAGSPRQVPLRSLTAFFLDRFAIGGTLGDFIPQTPSLGTSPQTPSSLRASYCSFSSYASSTITLWFVNTQMSAAMCSAFSAISCADRSVFSLSARAAAIA